MIELMKNIEKGEGVNVNLGIQAPEDLIKKTKFLAKSIANNVMNKLPSIVGGDPNQIKIAEL